MKKKNFNKKLSLNRRTIANLNSTQLKRAKGGGTYITECQPDTCDQSCDPRDTCAESCDCFTNYVWCTIHTHCDPCTIEYC
jgi:hypothetical protein